VNQHKELAIRYFRGEITSLEEKELYAWVKEDDQNLKTLHEWEEEWKSTESSETDEKWSKMMGRIAVREALEEGELRLKKRTPRWPYAIAAAIAAAVISIFTLKPEPEQQWYAMEAPAGEKCRVTLPDSSVVWLNSGSKLSMQTTFNRKTRIVHLEGEGYFDVTHDDTRPFNVLCGDVTVQVKGTRFNVSSYPGERFVSASVIEGHVVLSHGTSSIDLFEGQSADYDILARSFSRTTESPQDACAWTESRFIYNNITLYELTEKLSRAYAVRFHFDTARPLDYRFSISLQNNETLPEILSALERLIPVHTRIEGTDIYIKQ
jgi:ferric-dicitrate binding protein FerR (iron transport regulator)